MTIKNAENIPVTIARGGPMKRFIFFDEASYNWEKDAEVNYHFLRMSQDYLNTKIKNFGYITEKEFKDYLGLLTTEEDCAYKITKELDFGLDDIHIHNEYAKAFVNGYGYRLKIEYEVEFLLATDNNECEFCKELYTGDVNINILNGSVLAGSAKLFGCEVYLEDRSLSLFVSDANGSTIMNLHRIVNYCPMCGRKINVIK